MSDDPEFTVGRSSDLVEKFSVTQRKWIINPLDVPEGFRQFIPLLKKWAISDDTLRFRFVRSSSDEEKTEFVDILEPYESAIYTWLAGPEARGPAFTEAYLAFSVMMIALDEARPS